MFFGVAGSGQGADNPAPGEIPHGVSPSDARAYGTTIALVKSDLVDLARRSLAQARPVRYPAVSWLHYIGPDGLTSQLDASEERGAARLVGQIRRAYRPSCEGRPVLLAGYSQGAEVVLRAVDHLTRQEQRTVTVALLGDPSYQPGLPDDYPGHTTAAGLRPTLGIAGGIGLPRRVLAHTIDICAPGDPICGIPPSPTGVLGEAAWVLEHIQVHGTAYLHGRYAALAARFLWTHRVR